MKILVTGAAGFIGYYLSLSLLERENLVIGVDNLNNYYNPRLKKARLEEINKHPNSSDFNFIKGDISDRVFIKNLFDDNQFDVVVNLAAQAGVRYSLDNPEAYADSNLVGFLNILEGCRHSEVKHLVYASSSSVYGMNVKQPFHIDDRVDYPISLYAATKKSNELMAHAYSYLYDIPTTGLRFFTVYGPYGRPDMAYYKFTKALISGESIDIYNDGVMKRDFTYISDIVEGVVRVIDRIPEYKNNHSKHPSKSSLYKLYNIGNNKPVSLKRFINSIENSVGLKAKRNLMPMQPGDVIETHADIDDLIEDIEFKPRISIEEGIDKFVYWYQSTGKYFDI